MGEPAGLGAIGEQGSCRGGAMGEPAGSEAEPMRELKRWGRKSWKSRSDIRRKRKQEKGDRHAHYNRAAWYLCDI